MRGGVGAAGDAPRLPGPPLARPMPSAESRALVPDRPLPLPGYHRQTRQQRGLKPRPTLDVAKHCRRASDRAAGSAAPPALRAG